MKNKELEKKLQHDAWQLADKKRDLQVAVNKLKKHKLPPHVEACIEIIQAHRNTLNDL